MTVTWGNAAVILTLLVHLGVSIWWASRLTTTIEHLVKAVDELKRNELLFLKRSEFDERIKHSDDCHTKLRTDLDLLSQRLTACQLKHAEERK